MKNHKILNLGLIASFLATTEHEYSTYGKPKHYRKETVDADQMIVGISKKTEKQKAELNGLKEFDFGGNKIYALNQKNAERKAKKLGYIL